MRCDATWEVEGLGLGLGLQLWPGLGLQLWLGLGFQLQLQLQLSWLSCASVAAIRSVDDCSKGMA